VPDHLASDPGRVRQILTNLLGNAVKFTHEGEIALRVCVVHQDDARAVLRFSVRDTGVGVSEAARGHLFEPFVQADASTTRRFGGTGLGLSICKQLAGLLGGQVGVESDGEGHGSTFWFTLTAEKRLGAASIVPARPRREAFALPTGQDNASERRVLVVEDNPVNQKVLVRLLERRGLCSDVAENGAQALSRLSEASYDLVLMDVQMPVMDGHEATRRIRDAASRVRDRGVPVVAITANAHLEDRERCLEAGMDGYLSKPVRVDALDEILARYQVLAS